MTDSDSDDCDDMPGLVCQTNGASLNTKHIQDDAFDSGEEMFVDSLQPALDLFSSKTFRTAEECMDHCKEVHGLDLNLLKKRHSMDTFSYIRFINYIREEAPSPGFVMSLSSAEKWSDIKYMKPAIGDDPLLMFNFEEDLDSLGEEEDDENGIEIDISRELNDQIANPRNVFSNINISPEGEDSVRIPLDKFNELKIQYERMTKEVQEKEARLKAVMEDMTKMQSIAQHLMGPSTTSSSGSTETTTGSDLPANVSELKSSSFIDGEYFSSYDHYGIHHEMLSDSVRTESYRDSLLKNPGRLKDAAVLDIGCGTGILSMFAAQAGAKTVVGVDCSQIIYSAMDIIRENGLEDRVKLCKGKLEEIELPVEKFDIIVSEWMGYFLLYEGMLDTVITARDKYLAPGGTVLPNRCTLDICAVADHERYDSYVGKFWSEVYGLKMNCMRKPILEEASIEVIPGRVVVSDNITVLDLDLNTCNIGDTQFSAKFDLRISQDSKLTGLCGYFDIFFDLPESPVRFSTGPQSKPTHWKQTIFYLPEKMAVKKDQILNCSISSKRMKTDVRALKVSLTINEKTYRYIVD